MQALTAAAQGIKESLMTEKKEENFESAPYTDDPNRPLQLGERKIRGWAALKKGGDLEEFHYIAPALKPNDVDIRVTHCGFCHTDIAMINNELGMSKYPFIPGHEIVGIVEKTGSHVKHLKPGQRVGVGWYRSVCHACEMCHKGDDNLCADGVTTTLKGQMGGFAEYIRVDSFSAYPIPDSLPSAETAPLLDAAATVFAPLMKHKINHTHKVGVIGFGGLGHLFVKITAAMGCEVTVFSTSSEKESDAKAAGAHHFVMRDDVKALAAMSEKLDFILSTLYVLPDWTPYVEALKADGTMCLVGWTPANKPIEIPVVGLIYKQRKIVGSNVSPSGSMMQMLDFCARHNIVADSEIFDLDNCNAALKRFKEQPRDLRYRCVLRMPGAPGYGTGPGAAPSK